MKLNMYDILYILSLYTKMNLDYNIIRIKFDNSDNIKEEYRINYKNGHIISQYDHIEYYINGQIKALCKYVDGLRDGIYIEYYDNGIKKNVMHIFKWNKRR